MKLLTILMVGVLVAISSLHAQSPDTLWTRSYGSSGDAYASSIVPAHGGGYFVGGTICRDSVADKNGWKDTDLWVLRLDEQGDTLWSRCYGDSLSGEYSVQLIATADSGFAALGDWARDRDDWIYVVKADADGKAQWESTYPVGRSFARAVSIDQVGNNDLVVAFNADGNAEDFSVMRIYGGWGSDLDGAGEESFTVPYAWALRDGAGAVTVTSDKGFAVCGWTTSRSIIHSELFLLKSSEYGIIEWTQFYDSPNAELPRGIRPTRDGGFVVVGKASEPINSDAAGLYLLKVDADGEKMWSRSYEGSGGLDVIELPDGGFLATGWSGFTTRVSPSGEQIWSGSYGFDPGAALSAALSPDGGYILAGWRKTPDDDREIHIVRLAPGNIPTEVEDNAADLLPVGLTLTQNYPNPFNPGTIIEFELAGRSSVSVEILNVLGQKVRTLVEDVLPAGAHTVKWDGKNDAGLSVSTGVYFYRITAGDFVETRKMLLLK
ncbi:MAG: T9SS type A sorting domain-containing protein [bacterium]|nr:T9SS type A sorting domain-containing protein [bacterium]